MPSDLTPDRKTFWRAKAEKRSEWNGECSVSPFELLALLDAADERDRLRAALGKISAMPPGRQHMNLNARVGDPQAVAYPYQMTARAALSGETP